MELEFKEFRFDLFTLLYVGACLCYVGYIFGESNGRISADKFHDEMARGERMSDLEAKVQTLEIRSETNPEAVL